MREPPHYYHNGVRIAVRRTGYASNNGLFWLLTDHLGGTNVTLDSAGTRLTELRYYPFGDTRYNPSSQLTNYRFTGQWLDYGPNLYNYGSRWYDPVVGRFIQADSVVPDPGKAQDFNRYSYVRNNPLRYTDPTGYFSEEEIMKYLGMETWEEVLAMFEKGGTFEGQWGWLGVLHSAKIGDEVEFLDESSHIRFEGTFTEKNGELMLIAMDHGGAVRDPSVLLHSLKPKSFYLNRPYDDRWVYIGQYKIDEKPLYVRKVHWNTLLNPLELEEIAEFGGVTIFTGAFTGLIVSTGVGLCTTGVGCVAGGMLIGAGGGSGSVATILLMHATIERTRLWWHESIEFGP